MPSEIQAWYEQQITARDRVIEALQRRVAHVEFVLCETESQLQVGV